MRDNLKNEKELWEHGVMEKVERGSQRDHEYVFGTPESGKTCLENKTVEKEDKEINCEKEEKGEKKL